MGKRERDADRRQGDESSAAATIRAYYATLRAGEPLAPYFSEDRRAVKFGLTERLTGYEEIAEGLRTQTETTTDWTIASKGLVVGERAEYAWFADEASMAWTETTTGERHRYGTRWSGTLERRGKDNNRGNNAESHGGVGDEANEANDEEKEVRVGWQFVSMHVSRES